MLEQFLWMERTSKGRDYTERKACKVKKEEPICFIAGNICCFKSLPKDKSKGKGRIAPLTDKSSCVLSTYANS